MACRPDTLPLLATGRLPGLARWHAERHVKRCPDCAAEFARLQRLSERLNTAMKAEPSAELDERTLSIRTASVVAEKEHGASPLVPMKPLIGAILGLVLAGGVTLFQEPAYVAHGKMMLVPSSPSSNPYGVMTLIELMNASDVRRNLQSYLKPEEEMPLLTIQPVEKTSVVEITARSDNPDVAARITNRWMKTMQAHLAREEALARERGARASLEGDLRILNEAVTPTDPISPNRTLNLAVGFIVGGFLGGLMALLRRR